MNQSLINKTAQTLDQLWAEAERLGKVEVDHPIGGKEYRAEILFYRTSGSRVYAIGSDTNIHLAMQKAIDEAYALGVGR